MPLYLMSEERLTTPEWIAVAIICGVVLGIALSSRVPRHTREFIDSYNEHAVEPLLDVAISGAVEKPGIYRVPQGSKIGDLVVLAGETEQADRAKISRETLLKQGQSVRIPRKRRRGKGLKKEFSAQNSMERKTCVVGK